MTERATFYGPGALFTLPHRRSYHLDELLGPDGWHSEKPLALQRVAVASAGVLIGAATFVPAFSAVPGWVGLNVRTNPANTLSYWNVNGPWTIVPLAFLLLAAVIVVAAIFGDLRRVNELGRAGGAVGLIVFFAALLHVGLYARAVDGSVMVAHAPLAGSYFVLMASIFLVAWPNMWSAEERRLRQRTTWVRDDARIGQSATPTPQAVTATIEPPAMATLDVVAVDPQAALALSTKPRAVGPSVPYFARPAAKDPTPEQPGWYRDAQRHHGLRWWNGEQWTDHRFTGID